MNADPFHYFFWVELTKPSDEELDAGEWVSTMVQALCSEASAGGGSPPSHSFWKVSSLVP
jgi:hypothetical protein